MPGLRSELAGYFEDRFGVDPGYWERFACHESGDSIWITSRSMDVRDQHQTAGIRALRRTNLGLKPTTYILQFLGDELRKNVVRLEAEEVQRLVLEREELETDLPRGYVVLRFDGEVLGCGLVTGSGLRTQVPKGRTQELATMLDIQDTTEK
ncbi:MAG: hypothetical protein SVU32_09715 [Candidatus Nanohaloarchaea archaeon]|nr:hypothetical protein [Candidatus Nanohaloarchaea archaeon]